MEYEKSVLQNQKVNTILTTMQDNNLEENIPEVNNQFTMLQKPINLTKNQVKPLGLLNLPKSQINRSSIKTQYNDHPKITGNMLKAKTHFNDHPKITGNMLKAKDDLGLKKTIQFINKSPRIQFHESSDTDITKNDSMLQNHLISTDRLHLNTKVNEMVTDCALSPKTTNFSNYLGNKFSNNNLLKIPIDDTEFDMKEYKQNYKNHYDVKESMNAENAYDFLENNCKIEALESYLVALEKKLDQESSLRKNFQNKLEYIENVFNDLPTSNATKVSDKNFMFLYKIITKENPIIGRNCSDIRKIEW